MTVAVVSGQVVSKFDRSRQIQRFMHLADRDSTAGNSTTSVASRLLNLEGFTTTCPLAAATVMNGLSGRAVPREISGTLFPGWGG